METMKYASQKCWILSLKIKESMQYGMEAICASAEV